MSRKLVLIVLCLWISLPIFAQEDAEKFDRTFTKIQKKAKRAQWSKVQKLLDTVLKEHATAPYLMAKRRELLEYLERCAFHSEYPDAKPKDVVSGDLVSYDPRKGKIKIVYTENLRDFEKGGAMRVHPAKLVGPTTIIFSGSRHPKGKTLSALVDSTNKLGYAVIFGCDQEGDAWYPARIRRNKGGGWQDVDVKEMSPVKGGKKCILKIKVSAGGINVAYNNRGFLAAKKKRGYWGYWGIDRNSAIEKITLSGTVEPSWIKGLIDKRRQEDLARFKSDFKLKQVAPPWLLSEAVPVAVAGNKATRVYPGKLDIRQRNDLKRIYRWSKVGDWSSALKAVNDLPPSFPLVTRHWFLALCNSRLNQPADALREADVVLALDATFFDAGVIRAESLAALLRRKESRSAWRALVKSYPGEAYPYAELARLLLTDYQLAEAGDVLKDAAAHGHRSRRIKGLEEMLFRAKHGPRWERVFVSKSRHYEVHTDIDKSTAQAATKTLETAYLAYSAYMGRVKKGEERRFKVYIFSGEAGYHGYVRSLIGAPSTHTAGLYFPLLKQLLIWNLPDRKSMLKTVQHEGFHQFVDSITGEMPNWLNEGTAEYYETATSGKWTNTPIRKDHLDQLKGGVGSLSKFVRISYRDFYGNAPYNYARGWALVYFLRHSTAANKKILLSLQEKLKSHVPKKQAIEEVFGQLNMAAMKTEMESFLTGLRKK